MLIGDGETVGPSPHEAIMRLTRPPVDPVWLESELAMLERLVEVGETALLVATLDRIIARSRRTIVAAAPEQV